MERDFAHIEKSMSRRIRERYKDTDLRDESDAVINQGIPRDTRSWETSRRILLHSR